MRFSVRSFLAVNSIINGSFEDGTVKPAVNGFIITSQDNVPGWKTTASDGKIELWYTGFKGTGGAEGNTLAELNANQVATLYQDVLMTVSGPVSYSFLHRGRSGVDVMDFQIDVLVGGQDSAVSSNLYTTQISTGTSWVHYSGTAVTMVDAGKTYRFSFISILPVGATGNLLDAASFGIDLDGDGVPDYSGAFCAYVACMSLNPSLFCSQDLFFS